ncbi:uncharacterized protein EV420DRAFT_1280272 [Desarmillaria tabescens]|uniref:Nephrocystin 3-like N-terminal domain-containing protein n=1 Tax=Armillaria tabescens TaxID=1929756 RepID=A0AA39J9Z5_ARMTA|nr:uncharacterized protein EV420DRAFT_1280272 [Desarmillaria tabescens]KAK0438150.1 hypothetical protein EV420DRAFT_1280272 [Desarmillaria tabescens]
MCVYLADEKAKTLAAWLSSLDYNAVQRNTLRKRVGDTGQWFLDSSKFRSWVDGSGTSRTLWCPGDPGAGKTVLASLIVDYLRPLVAQKNMAVLCVFCDYRNAGAQTVTSIIRSLLKQLIPIDAGLYSSIESLYEKCHNDQIDPSLDDLEAHLSTQLKKYSPVYLVLDALDEFPGDYGEWRNLIAALESLGDNVRLLVTSRNYSTIRKLFEGDDELCIRAEDGDIRKFITSQLDVAGRFNLYLKDRDDLREKILTGVVEKAKGM